MGLLDVQTPDLQTGGGTHLYNLYNPSESDLNDFASWLWSANVMDQLAKAFSNPLESIISLSKSYLPINATTDKVQIKFATGLGDFSPSGITMRSINNQYNKVTVGTIDVFVDDNDGFFRYDPFSIYKLYLPFVGMVDLPSDVLFHSILSYGSSGRYGRLTIQYYNDCITGATIASVLVHANIDPAQRATGTQITDDMVAIMQYGCNTSVNYALTGSNYTGFVSGLANVAAGVGMAAASAAGANPAGVAQGGAMALGGAAGMITSGVGNTTGGFTASTGALGIKRPYVVKYTRNTKTGHKLYSGESAEIDYIANNVMHMRANAYTTLQNVWNTTSYHGYVRTLDANVAFDGCTEDESAEISRIMNNEGFYFE